MENNEVEMTLEEFEDFCDTLENMPHCMNCANCIYIGEGDSICDALDEPVLVLSDFEPTDDYFCCGGSEYEEN